MRDVRLDFGQSLQNIGLLAVIPAEKHAHKTKVTELVESVTVDAHPTRDELIVHVYNELRRLATGYLSRERADHTLQPTALVHEAYMRLAAQDGVDWQNREHVLGVAATIMRRVLVDHARGHRRYKRWGGLKATLAEADGCGEGNVEDLLALDEALTRLARRHPQKSQVVELRFFGGLSIEETARIMAVSDSTVERDWKFARAWLAREMTPGRRHG